MPRHWSTTPFSHPTRPSDPDIINQTDLARNPNGEEKLGQPMVNLSLVREWGIVDLFLLVGHRERIFRGDEARFQTLSLPIAWDRGEYADPDEEQRIDMAFPWQHYYGDWEWAVSHFSGTSRDPILRTEQSRNGKDVVIPFYTKVKNTIGKYAYFMFAPVYFHFVIGPDIERAQYAVHRRFRRSSCPVRSQPIAQQINHNSKW